MKNSDSRRDFIKKTVTGAAALSIGGVLPGFSAKSYGRILGANERVQVAMMGVNSRGLALASNFAAQKNCEVRFICDVDKRAAEKCISTVSKIQNKEPLAQPDFRKALEVKDLDALVIAAQEEDPDARRPQRDLWLWRHGVRGLVEEPCTRNLPQALTRS